MSKLVSAWLDNIANENVRTSKTVKYHMQDFETYCRKDLGIEVDWLVKALVKKHKDVYVMLTTFVTFLKNIKLDKGLLTERVLRLRVKAFSRKREFGYAPRAFDHNGADICF